MRITDIKHGQSETIEVKMLGKYKKDSFKRNSQVKLFSKDNKFYLLSFSSSGEYVSIEGQNKSGQESLDRLVKRNLSRLITVVDNDGKKLILEIKNFTADKMADFEFGINDKFIDKVKMKIKLKDLRNPQVSLNDEFIIEGEDGYNYAVMAVNIHANSNEKIKNFILAGRKAYVSINTINEDGSDFFFAKDIMANIKKEEYSFYLIKGKLNFIDETTLGKAKAETIFCMNQIGDSIDSYLNSWTKYGELEQKKAFEKAKKAGVLKYSNIEYDIDKSSLRVDIQNTKALKKFAEVVEKDCSLTILNDDPRELFSSELNVQSYRKFINNKKKETVKLMVKIDSSSGSIYVQSKKVDEIRAKFQAGYIIYSLDGFMSIFGRREAARDKILTANCGMPHLATILEGKSINKPEKRNIEPLSPAVMSEIFNINPPTEKQKDAISIALNTPDIAVIQGPPGTGKTTVIRAILQRLNEIADSSDGMFGRNLISAFQHDAVENAVERINILGLPAIKIGKKSTEVDDSIEVIESKVRNWIFEKNSLLRERHLNIIEDDYIKHFSNIRDSYLLSANTIDNTIKLLEEMKKIVFERLDMNIVDKINNIVRDLKFSESYEDDDREELIKYISRIRYTKAAYEDDGEVRIKEVLRQLKHSDFAKEFSKEIEALKRILREYCGDEKQLNILRKIRKNLLSKTIVSENIFSRPKQKEDILTLLNEIENKLYEEYQKSVNSEDMVIKEYIDNFEENPVLIRDSIMNYISVLGATNQQAVGEKIGALKGKEFSYDNVLIDEAARSNPLDLFIPMALAKDRIILVGDHRQLPHIVDESIVEEIEEKAKELDGTVRDKIKDNIKSSMFEKLFTTLKQLEKKDNITRTITLDIQYRTHEVLGDFISENFYEVHKESKVKSELKAEMFKHNADGLENKACVWMDIPAKNKKEQEIPGSSKSRKIEAQRIAEHLKKLIDSDNTNELSFGIITFYSKQVEAIYEELCDVKVKIATKNDDDTYELLPKYKYGYKNGKQFEKLRIGTVDAFQGMEFDIVYLSMVRSNDYDSKTEKDRQKKYGHLMVENRLCVSMSRQKKMLIVAGDSKMLWAEKAEEAIEPLINFYKLCEKEKIYGEII